MISQRIKFLRPHVIAIFLIAFGFFFVGIHRAPVPTVDGAVRASMARGIVENHSLWPIFYEGHPFIDHPPLFVWLTAGSFKLFGVTDLAANLVPRLFAFLTVIVTAAIALEAGFSPGTALLAALVLCLTRDFVLSSVRGYIEPLLEFWSYLAFWLTLRQRRAPRFWPAAAAGACVWLAAFSKGPVALWPFLFLGALLIQNQKKNRTPFPSLTAYLGSFGLLTALWALWVSINHFWPDWQKYFFGQVLGSALEGRGGAQEFEPFYFLKILAKYYWPWLPFLVLAYIRAARLVIKRDFAAKSRSIPLFGLFGLGFIGGFSMMKWKFWYYIAPAYPAFALLIAGAFETETKRVMDRTGVAQALCFIGVAWALIGSLAPIPLYRERVPEVIAFKDLILKSDLPGPVWYVDGVVDHNLIGTSGNWYFHRTVEKVSPESKPQWLSGRLKAPAWIITGSAAFKNCREPWCLRSTAVACAGQSALLYYRE